MKKIGILDNFKNYKSFVSTLWIFATLNYLYCDVMTLMDGNLLRQYLTGTINGLSMTQQFLLIAAFLMEIPMLMTVLSRVLPFNANRICNIIAGLIMTIVQTSSLFGAMIPIYYKFMSIIEISTTVLIVILSIRQKNLEEA